MINAIEKKDDMENNFILPDDKTQRPDSKMSQVKVALVRKPPCELTPQNMITYNHFRQVARK